MKRRCDVVVFVKTDYDFNLDSVKEVMSKYKDDNKVPFVCLQCQYYLRGLSLGNKRPKLKKPSNETEYLCTCCHAIFQRKKQVVFFKKKNYNFENKCVQVALSEQVRCKNSIYEHICVTVRSRMFTVFLQTNGFRRCAGLFSSIVTLKGGLSRWLPSSGGPCHVY